MTHTVRVASIDQLTPDVKQFRLVAEDYRFDFKPGQHTQIRFSKDGGGSDGDGGEEVVRPYTGTNLPGTNQLTLAIRRYEEGTASTWMHEREIGDEIEVESLDGNLYLRNLDADVAFISTGTGITPMMAMLKQYLLEGTGEAHFLYGEKTRDDVIYLETLDQFEASYPELTVDYSLSEEDWPGRTGHIQDHLEDVFDSFDDRDYYVCGVPRMVVETKRKLIEGLGVPEERVYSEGWEDDEVTEENQ
jgi:ferredoxin-NADP reductase